MPYEVKDWKAPGCSLSIKTADLSIREEHSSEINEAYGEGGGLNANYQTVEAIAIVANILGEKLGMQYGVDFVFKTSGLGLIHFDFRDEARRKAAEPEFWNIFQRFLDKLSSEQQDST
jgi:hypothetical protein